MSSGLTPRPLPADMSENAEISFLLLTIISVVKCWGNSLWLYSKNVDAYGTDACR